MGQAETERKYDGVSGKRIRDFTPPPILLAYISKCYLNIVIFQTVTNSLAYHKIPKLHSKRLIISNHYGFNE